MNTKRILTLIVPLALFITSCATTNPEYLISGGAKVLQAATLTDAQIQAYVGQYVTQLDAESKVLPESSPYVKRVRNMTKGLASVEGIPLNFKVYQTSEVNAFACADGSVRIFTGLLDVMNDDEVLGVVGHEIGHVALKHSRKQFQQALMTSAVRDAIVSTGGNVAVLTASQLGDIGEALAGSSFSRKQESQADDYGYDFLKKNGKNPWAMAMAFEELLKLSGGSAGGGAQAAVGSSVTSLFSSHPATQTRIQNMSARAVKDGYLRPSSTKPAKAVTSSAKKK